MCVCGIYLKSSVCSDVLVVHFCHGRPIDRKEVAFSPKGTPSGRWFRMRVDRICLPVEVVCFYKAFEHFSTHQNGEQLAIKLSSLAKLVDRFKAA